MTTAAAASLRGYVYKPRLTTFVGVRTLGRWHVKATVITVRGKAVHFPEIVDEGWSVAEKLLAGVVEAGGDAGVAHLTLHIGMAGVWLLLDWWHHGDMLMHRHFHAPLDDPTRFADVGSRHDGPDLWEVAVQAHEREAWLRHVLANPAGPDIDAYLQDGLSAFL